MKFVSVGLTIWLLFTINHTQAQRPEEKLLAPYFFIPGIDDEVEMMPVKDISADVHISGTIADVIIEQTFENTGTEPIEATYVFPGSTNAAIYSLEMVIGDRVIKAEIAEREEARRTYKSAKKAGKRASLLEQNRPNVFEMNVANIMPNDVIKTRLRYTEMIEPTDGKYQFVFPTTVGPRYSTDLEASARESDQWVSNPYLHSGISAPYSFKIDVKLSTGLPIQDIRSTSHDVNVNFTKSDECSVTLTNLQEGNRDFMLEYFLKGKQINTGILVHKDTAENFFTLMVQPPEIVKEEEIPNREYVFVIDVSGSMDGYPIRTAKELMNNLLSSLKPTDLFNITLFEYGSKSVFSKSVPCTPSNISKALSLMMKQQGSGGTNLYAALNKAIKAEPAENYSRSMVVVTDGYISAERDVFELIKKNLGETNVYAFGIGTAVNRYLIEGIAKAGMGEHYVVERKGLAKSKAQEFMEYINRPALTNISIDYGSNLVREVWPKSIPDVLPNRPIIVHGKYVGEFDGEVTLSGDYGYGRYETKLALASDEDQNNPALKYLWARTAISELVDYNIPRVDEIEKVKKLGLKYSLLTEYTSFVAVDNMEVNSKKNLAKVKQPIPLPAGVSDNAVGYQYSNYTGSYSNKMYTTGATCRASEASLSVIMPSGENKFDVSNDFFALRWVDVDGAQNYIVTIKTIFNETLASYETGSEGLWIDLTSPELQSEAPLLIIGVSSKLNPEIKSDEIAIRKVYPSGLTELPGENDKRPTQFYLDLAHDYEDRGLLIDAFSVFEMAMIHYPDNDDLMTEFEDFLFRNSMLR